MEKIKIIVCCHKDDIYKSSDIFMPLHVGKAISDKDLGILGDNTGENISHKNASYCELTGMYWAWKNLKEVDYIGLCHYRRYFDFNHEGRRFFPLTTIKTADFERLNLDPDEEAIDWLRHGGCIVSKATHLKSSVYSHYCEGHYSTDFRLLGDIVRDTLPQKYFNAFWSTMLEGNIFYPFNMFVMNWNTFDNYCNWLFTIIKSVEEKTDISNYSVSQQRIYGYMAERLLNVYIKAEHLKIKKYPVLKISNDKEIDDIPACNYIIRTALQDIATKLLFKL